MTRVINEPRYHEYASVYGKFIIDFNELSNCIVEWTINVKAIVTSSLPEVSVGIIEIDPKSHHERLWNLHPFDTKIAKYYGLWISVEERQIDLEGGHICEIFQFDELNITTEDLETLFYD